ncbi:MAG: hypothetical protein JSU00_13210 [Acidobacteria bacterium]|nr:hypothetical protein [Acidobacteriota bacterium]
MRNIVLYASLAASVLVPTVGPCRAGEHGARVEYIGGTRADLPNRATGNLQAVDEQYLVFYSGKANFRVAYDRINLLEYGQKVNRRLAMAVLISPVFALSKSRQHFLTVGYTDEAGREQALIFKVEKEHIRAMLASLEVRTGRKVEFQDEEARKAGRG